MRFRQGANLDTSQVRDIRGRSGGIALAGGGGLMAIIVTVVTMLVQGGGGTAGLPSLVLGAGANDASSNPELATACKTGADANQSEDCLVVAVVNSVQDYWGETIPGYQTARTTFFTGQVNTGCGAASSAVGPFYCPPDQGVYVDLEFFGELESTFGARGGPFAEAYVIAHEYGHHVQNLLQISERAGDGSTGPTSSSVRLELQADCFAGVWAAHAVDTGFIEELTDDDIAVGLDAAAAVGDDRIQQKATGRVEPESWTHGSAEQRQRWFRTGFQSGNQESCDTFAASTL